MIRKHIYFSGHVQGVGFRYTAIQTARRYHLTGWVKNLYDGRVEMEVQGTLDHYELLMQAIKHQFAIHQIQIQDCEIRQNESEFDLKW
ncbi:acylphosphatase [Beduini massiliensis]|uniref:acylphosphatase n=1 Tax=Beduini massiliensis TaxID=1585974 RepID=UPI00059A8A94|nr:acylphosphatase [Beduini massiliensis]